MKSKETIAKMLATRKRNRELRQKLLAPNGVKVGITCATSKARPYIAIETNLSMPRLMAHLRALAGPGEVA